MPVYPLVNDIKFDHSSAEIQIGATLFTGIESIEWSESLEPGIVRGTVAQKLARTAGEHDAEGGFALPIEDFGELIATLGEGYGGVSFNIVVTYSNEGQNVTTVELIGCRITEHSGGSEAGGDPTMEEISIDIMEVKHNGLRMFPGALAV